MDLLTGTLSIGRHVVNVFGEYSVHVSQIAIDRLSSQERNWRILQQTNLATDKMEGLNRSLVRLANMPNSPETTPNLQPSITDLASMFDAWYSALMNSHLRLTDLVAGLTPEELEGSSYASEWNIAQVLSHLGSGAEIFSLLLKAGLNGDPAPEREVYLPIWERWNAKRPEQQTHDSLRFNAEFLEQMVALDDSQRRALHLSMFGQDQDVIDLLRLRLSEHAVHTWDVAVALDQDATIASDAVVLLLDILERRVNRSAKPTEKPIEVRIVTQDPKRLFVLNVNIDGAVLRPLTNLEVAEFKASLELPAEAFIRLVYGRLGLEHRHKIYEDGVDIDALRQVFPGF